jgi:hypothetical protein
VDEIYIYIYIYIYTYIYIYIYISEFVLGFVETCVALFSQRIIKMKLLQPWGLVDKLRLDVGIPVASQTLLYDL